MPIYEYSCRECGGFEVTQKITDKPLTRCPACKGKVKKLISSTSFQLKGTGWYVTDYARKDKAPKEQSHKAEAKSDGKAASGSDGGDKSSAEKKPAKTATSESTAP